MNTENETILHRHYDDDDTNKARQIDGQRWTVECYDAKTIKAMIEAQAQPLPTVIDGKLFEVDARQLIEFIAASSGLVVEFRKRKRRQDSEETKAKLLARLQRTAPETTA